MTEVNELTTTLQQTPVLVFSMDKVGKVLSIMGLEAERLGLDESLIGQTLFKNSSFPCKRSYFKRALAGGKFSLGTLRRIRGNSIGDLSTKRILKRATGRWCNGLSTI